MPKILLVDDEPSILNVLSVLLKTEGYEITPAQGGEKAIELLKNSQFDLMISDIRISEPTSSPFVALTMVAAGATKGAAALST